MYNPQFSKKCRAYIGTVNFALSLLVLTACGGGSDNKDGDVSGGEALSTPTPATSASPTPPPVSTPTPVPVSTPTPDSHPIGISETLANTLVASGRVEVLVYDSEKGEVKTAVRDLDSRSLYFFDSDQVEVSNCSSSQCLYGWSPVLAQPESVAEFPLSLFNRADGHAQWGWRGLPLYLYTGDSVAGDTFGANVAQWRLAQAASFKIGDSVVGSVLAGTGKVRVATFNGTNEVVELQDRHNRTLYTWAGDSAGLASVCVGDCVNQWPPFIADSMAQAVAPYSLIPRTETGELQWAYQGMPLYFYAMDSNPGQALGDGLESGGQWQVARDVPVTTAVVSIDPADGYLWVGYPASMETSSRILVGGEGLVDAMGSPDSSYVDRTLYYFASDFDSTTGQPKGGSFCSGSCLDLWPPLYADAEAASFGDFGIIVRSDSQARQWTYKGAPLYFYAGDSAAGDINGQSTAWPLVAP